MRFRHSMRDTWWASNLYGGAELEYHRRRLVGADALLNPEEVGGVVSPSCSVFSICLLCFTLYILLTYSTIAYHITVSIFL